MTNEQAHELILLYFKEKCILANIETPEQLTELYDESLKRLSKKYYELNPPKKEQPRKRGTVSKGIDAYYDE